MRFPPEVLPRLPADVIPVDVTAGPNVRPWEELGINRLVCKAEGIAFWVGILDGVRRAAEKGRWGVGGGPMLSEIAVIRCDPRFCDVEISIFWSVCECTWPVAGLERFP